MRRIRSERGIGLIEVLLAVLVLSIGFLATARMQIQGLKFSQEAYHLSQANLLLRDMADRMRANRQGVLSGAYTGFASETGYAFPACYTGSSICSASDQAKGDKASWALLMHGDGSAGAVPLLPSGSSTTASARIIRNDDNTYTLEVLWSGLADNTEVERRISLGFMP